MSVTEIYCCRPGQKLKEGRLDYSHDIQTRAQAEADAKRRIMQDNSLAKIAYYTVGDSGDYKLLYTHTNEPKPQKQAVRPVSKKPDMLPRAAAPRKAAPPPKPQSLLDKIISSIKK